MALWPQCPEVGIHSGSAWNKPEPEIALAANSRGETVGASLGNNVNPRNFKGSSSMVKISRTRWTGRDALDFWAACVPRQSVGAWAVDASRWPTASQQGNHYPSWHDFFPSSALRFKEGLRAQVRTSARACSLFSGERTVLQWKARLQILQRIVPSSSGLVQQGYGRSMGIIKRSAAFFTTRLVLGT